MNADELDGRIRSLVHDAVAAAPPAPTLPTSVPVAAPPNRGRGWVWAGIGIAASLIAGVVLVMSNRDDDPSIVAGSTSAEVSTTSAEPTLPWPDGVAVIVASERGIEKVTAENGQAVVTRLLSGVSVERAFELEDGSIVYQTATDGIVRVLGREDEEPLANDVTLEDADAPDGNLRLVYRSASDSNAAAGRVTAWFQPAAPTSADMPGGFGVGYRRFTIVNGYTVMASTLDDTLQRSTFTFSFGDGEQLAPGFENPFLVVGDGAGTYIGIDENGSVDMTGTRSGHITTIDPASSVIDMDVRGQWMTVTDGDGSMTLVDMTTGAPYQLPLSGGGGTVSVSRMDRADTQPVPTTVVSPSTSLEPTPTTVPVTVADPFPNCLTVTSDVAADVQFDSSNYTLEPVPEEAITVAGRPAVLQTWGGGFGVVLRQPDWCTDYRITTFSMSKAEFVAWLDTLSVVETLPPNMPPVLLRSSYGLSIVSTAGSTVIARGAVDQALLLADGRVVYHAPDLGPDFQLYDPATGRSDTIWAAADWVAMPMLHDAFGTSFAFSVRDRLYSYDTDQRWPLNGIPTQRISVFDDGQQLLATPDAPAAMDPAGELQVSALPGGEVVVLRFADGAILYRSVDTDSTVTDVDINHGWVTISQVPPGDSLPVVRMVEIATGRELVFRGVDGAHLG